MRGFNVIARLPVIDNIKIGDSFLLYSETKERLFSMEKLLPRLFIILFLCAGCAIPLPMPSFSASASGGGQAQGIQATTSVWLANDNYRILKTNVVGTDWGISLLGILPIVSPDYTKAIGMLYNAGEVSEGRPQAVVNILQQNSSPFFILFSIPRITFRADVVEFTKAIPTQQP